MLKFCFEQPNKKHAFESTKLSNELINQKPKTKHFKPQPQPQPQTQPQIQLQTTTTEHVMMMVGVYYHPHTPMISPGPGCLLI